jgi:hypothetical protein
MSEPWCLGDHPAEVRAFKVAARDPTNQTKADGQTFPKYSDSLDYKELYKLLCDFGGINLATQSSPGSWRKSLGTSRACDNGTLFFTVATFCMCRTDDGASFCAL